MFLIRVQIGVRLHSVALHALAFGVCVHNEMIVKLCGQIEVFVYKRTHFFSLPGSKSLCILGT